MEYTQGLEYIISEAEESTSTQKLISGRQKEKLLTKLKEKSDYYTTHIDDRVIFKSGQRDGIEDAMTLSPIVLNTIASRGYKNVLFVGHYNQGKSRNWTNKNVELLSQFVPILHKEYGYEFGMTVLKPTEKRNLGTMWYFYDEFDLDQVHYDGQYVHGSKVRVKDIKEEIDQKFDAVVFVGVPADSKMTVNALRTVWKRWCTDEFELFDLSTEQERFNEDSKEFHTDLSRAFSLKSDGDREDSVDPDWKPEVFQKLRDSIRIY